jgi:origin recognition complex subunit 1
MLTQKLRRTVERVRSKGRTAGIPDVMQVISLTQNTPTAGYVAQCSFHEKVMLAAALMEVRWTGVEEFTWSKVPILYTHRDGAHCNH